MNLPFVAIGPAGPLHLERSIKRSELEIWTRELIDRTMTACKAVLADAKLTPQQVGQVVLVGGMTRMPAVQKAVKEFFGRDPNKGVNPDQVVAVVRPFKALRWRGKSTRCCCSTSRRCRSASRRAAACSPS